MNSQNQSTLEAHQDEIEFENWILERVKPNINSRISKYFEFAKSKASLINQGLSTDQIREKISTEQDIKLTYEFMQLTKCWLQLRHKENDGLVNKFVESFNGPVLVENEKRSSSSNKPRDSLTELQTASILEHEFDFVEFEKPCDVNLISKTNRAYVECKRPNAYKNVRKNINKAYKQLKKARDLGVNGEFKIALNLSNCVGAPNKILMKKNLKLAEQTLNEEYNDFVIKFSREIKSVRDVVGDLVLFIFIPAWLTEPKEFKYILSVYHIKP